MRDPSADPRHLQDPFRRPRGSREGTAEAALRGSLPEQLISGVEIISALRDEPGN